MDQRVREDIAAAAAAHEELGPGYSGSVAESLVDRIGAEIDKRVELHTAAKRPARAASGSGSIVLALGSMIIGGMTTVGLSSPDDPHAYSSVIIIMWIVIGIINLAN